MLNSVVAAQVPHDFIFRGWEVQCPGNPLSHTILRGAVNKHGQTIPNYHYEDLRLLYELKQQSISQVFLQVMEPVVRNGITQVREGLSS